MHFLGILYLGPQGVLRPEIFTRARDWARLPSAHPNWDGGPPKHFNRENQKFGLKFSVCASITSGLVGVTSRDFFQSTSREAGVITWVQFLQCPPPKICEGKKASKIFRDFWQLSTLIANISGKDQHNKNRKSSSSSTTPPTLDGTFFSRRPARQGW